MTLTKEHAMASAVIWRQIFTIVNLKYTSTALNSAFNTHIKYIKSSIFSEF